MDGLKLLATLVAAGALSTAAAGQTTNTVSNSMAPATSGSTGQSAMHSKTEGQHHAMGMQHMRSSKKMSMAHCEHMCRMMMKHHGKMMKHHGKTMKHDM